VEQPNGHHVEQTEAHAEPDAKAHIASPVVAPESSSEEPGNSPKEKGEEEEKGGQADVLPAAESTGSAASETSRAEAEIADVAGEAVELSGDQPDEQSQSKRPLSADSSASHGDATIESPAVGAGTTTNDPDAAEPERPSRLSKRKMPAVVTEEEVMLTPAPTPAAGARHPPLPPPRHPRPVRSTEQRALSDLTSSSLGSVNTGSVGVGKSDKAAEEPEFAPDGTSYVGDGTWEERTWKELTRLREDMFWARVGSAH
jgi:hypothetical protein